MPRPIRVSVPRNLLHADDPNLQAYLAAIADRDLSIELFTQRRHQPDGPLGGFMNEELYNESAVLQAKDLDHSVDSIHMTPLLSGCSSDGARICADKVTDAMLGYGDAVSGDDIDRYRYCDPKTVVFHPPRLPADDPIELGVRRQQLVGTLANANERLRQQAEIPDVPTITIENVCPRGSFTYLLTEPADIDRLATARDQLQTAQDADVTVSPVAYTLDLGHAAEPLAMLDAMGCPDHVHLHGSTKNTAATRRQLRNEYGLESDASVGDVEPGNRLQHLPPEAGDEPLESIVDKLEQSGYTGPLVLEFAAAYRTAETLHDSVDAIRQAGW
ncbi:TIM barrel protein [Salinigranum halophilum]|uniref:TIM barrel protein n=1 Tax=Salinigranum halophilum TaxID=2565931 RepID=UPI00115D7FC0|nr:TIM barrel protein [Salinigranum halophilum]